MSDAANELSHATLMRRAAWAAVSVATFLVAFKAVAYILTDSVAMMASLADSALDLFASAINVLAIRHALTPADREHRFGHGKAEPLAGLFQAAFIAGSVAFLIVESAGRLFEPRPIDHATIGLVVMAIAIAFTIVLVIYQQIAINKTGSIAVSADRMHYVSDLLTNVGVVISIVLATQFGWLIADPLISFLVAAVLAWTAWKVFRDSYDQLMDRELPDAERDKIKAIVRRHPEVLNLHDLRTRAAGIHNFIQFHIELDPQTSLTRAHEVSDEVEHEVCAAYPHAQVIIHQDPAGTEIPPDQAEL
ncbi:MAG TPA: cation diffusion facilitator family transporter [Rhizomicrobium sp.]|nr:cation diffusion facilitator family transporter [Rhizomicrobium sp.]